MRFRPSGESFLFFLRGGLIAGAAMGTVAAAACFGLPTFFGVTVAEPVSSARTCFNKAISRSTDARISDTPIRTSIDEDDRSELRSTWPQPFISDSPEDTIFANQLFGKSESVLKRSSYGANTPIETHKAGRKFKSRAAQLNHPRNLARGMVVNRHAALVGEESGCICRCHEFFWTSTLHSLKSLQNASTRARSVSHENMIRAAPPMNV